jgi:Na+-translocating ferredoxin:NAD+ oxidoreductase subunit B
MTLVYTILVLSLLGLLSAVILYFVAQKFKVFEDPRIDTVADALPGANCGGCGFAGCRNFAEALVKTEDAGNLFCPVGGNTVMTDISKILGREAEAREPKVAVIRCNGTPTHRPRVNKYDGVKSCAIEHALYTGETGCSYGCLGQGDCVPVCKFDAIHMNAETGLPEVDDEKCTSCGACVKACPRHVIELRKKSAKDRKIYVSCINEDKGALAKKYCSVACIGCGKCVKVCPHEAITLQNNLAFIDSSKCKLCRKCVSECPTSAILEINFPVRKSPAEPKLEDAALS